MNVARIEYFICYTTGLDNIAFPQLHSKLNSTYFSILNSDFFCQHTANTSINCSLGNRLSVIFVLQYLCRKLDTLSQDMITSYQTLSNLITMSSDPVVIISISHCSIKMIYLANRNYRIRQYPIKFYNPKSWSLYYCYYHHILFWREKTSYELLDRGSTLNFVAVIIFVSTLPPLHVMQFQTNQTVIANFLFIQVFVIWNSIFIYR